MRGDHFLAWAWLILPVGTPPRARGSPRRPAEARDHSTIAVPSSPAAGTPPRARGSRLVPVHTDRAPGNTPACAGITAAPSRGCSPSPEHPRVRGDHHFGALTRTAIDGTPPRARGSPRTRFGSSRRTRNTPACAGITHGPAPGGRTRGEHPRVRGDHFRGAECQLDLAGTPPRARGSRSSNTRWPTRPWNTPACAGITPPVALHGGTAREHPRVRGDHTSTTRRTGSPRGTPPRARDHYFSLFTNGEGQGTPPRARGSPENLPTHLYPTGNTPACAGITCREAPRRSPHPEHPRVRGDHVDAVFRSVPGDGTPPRARGSHRAGRAAGAARGNTPACAGITMGLTIAFL